VDGLDHANPMVTGLPSVCEDCTKERVRDLWAFTQERVWDFNNGAWEQIATVVLSVWFGVSCLVVIIKLTIRLVSIAPCIIGGYRIEQHKVPEFVVPDMSQCQVWKVNRNERAREQERERERECVCV
jgi:hypothetical protein